MAVVTVVLLGILVYVFYPKYQNSHHPTIERIRSNFALINPSYSKIPIQEGNSSYTEGKEVITLCISDPVTKKLYDMNTMMYVALHELAHVISRNHGHGDEWKDNFDRLLKRASDLGVYDPSRPIPNTYCGIHKNS